MSLGQNDPTDLVNVTMERDMLADKYERLCVAARAVLETEWADYLVGDDRAALERLREALNA